MEHWWYAHGGTPAGYVIDQLPPSLREEVRFRVFKGTTINSRVFLPLWEQRKAKGGAGKGAKGPQKGPKGKKGAAAAADAEPTEEDLQEKKQAALRETIARELVLAIEFEVYNPGEWVLHKGMLNECFYVITVGVAQVQLIHTAHTGPAPHSPLHLHLSARSSLRAVCAVRGAGAHLRA